MVTIDGPFSHQEALALPPELRKLEQMLQERREQAISRYPVNEQGLLARFSPRGQPPTQTSPAAQQPSHPVDRVLQSVKDISPSDVFVSAAGVGRGGTALSMGACDGRPLGNMQSSFNPLPSIGRGVLQLSQAQNPRRLW